MANSDVSLRSLAKATARATPIVADFFLTAASRDDIIIA